MTTTPGPLPTSLHDLLGYSAPCACGRTHEVTLARVSLGRGALGELPEIVRDIGARLSLCVVADPVTAEVAGNTVAKRLSSAGHRVVLCLVEGKGFDRPHADDANVAFVSRALEESRSDAAIAVGAGTISDLVKLASFERHIPYVAVPTAPSMNGFTSAIAAILREGVKRTVPCRQPCAVVADLDILSNAPLALARAGLGDLESKPTSTADFRLAHWVCGSYYCGAPERVVFEAEARAAEAAEGIGRGDPESVARLTEALLASGVSMALAGTSAPASGGEHLLSHFWDMTAAEEGRREGLHGAQVGVATIAMAALYEELLGVDVAALDLRAIAAALPSRDETVRRIRRNHGPRAEEIIAETLEKRVDGSALERRLCALRSDWPRLRERLSEMLRASSRVREVLARAGAPTTAREIGITDGEFLRAAQLGREIRGRYTVLDLAFELWDVGARALDAAIRRSACLSAHDAADLVQ